MIEKNPIPDDLEEPDSYAPASIGPNGELTVNGYPIEEWMYKDHGRPYDIHSFLTRSFPDITQDQAVDMMIDKKREEAEWAQFIASEETPSSDFCRRLPDFCDWIISTQIYSGDHSSSVQWIKPGSMIKPFMRASVKAMHEDPSRIASILSFFNQLNSLPHHKIVEGYYGQSTINFNNKKFIDSALKIMGGLAKEDYAVRTFGEEFLDDAVKLAEAMTEAGIISPTFWYREGIRRKYDGLNFLFMDSLHSRILRQEDREDGPDAIVGERNYRRMRADGLHLAETVLRDAQTDPNRNPEVTSAISKIMDHAKERDGAQTASHILQTANVISRLINQSGDIEESEGEKIELGQIDATDFQAVPLALARLLQTTRIDVDSTKAQLLEYKDTVYVDLLDWILERSQKLYVAQLGEPNERLLFRVKQLYPRASKAELDAIVRSGGRIERGVWDRWRPGYGVLS